MLIKQPKDRIGSGPNDGEDVFVFPFITASGYDRKETLAKTIIDEYFPIQSEGVQSESLDSGIIEPMTALFPGISRSEFKMKLEIEFGGS